MGIKGLENFIYNGNSHIAESISIPDEIKKWRSERSVDPTIVVDIKEFLRVFGKIDEGGLILGGRFDHLNDLFVHFFGKIKNSGVNLVFVGRLDCARFENIDGSLKLDNAYDCIRNQKSLTNHLEHQKRINKWEANRLRPNDRLWYNVMALCKQYGQVVCSYGWGRGTVLSCVRKNNVMALITRDTEFLVYSGEFEFWTLSDVDFRKLKITRFGREKFNLSTDQMKLLCILSQFGRGDRERMLKNDGSFKACISYIKGQKLKLNRCDITRLKGRFSDEKLTQLETGWKELELVENNPEFEDIYEEFILNLTKDGQFNSIFQFCKDNLYFGFKLIIDSTKSSVQNDMIFVDLRRPDSNNFLEMVGNLILKLYGIIFKDIDSEKRLKSRAIYLKTDGKAELVEMDIKYLPDTLTLPTLTDLIVQEDDERFTESRWSLFAWLLGLSETTIAEMKKSSNSKYIRLALFTLKLLLRNEQIPNREADVILAMEMDSQSKNNIYVPKNRLPPPMPNNRFPTYVKIDWVITAHKYTIAFELVCHCLEMCGLRKETCLITFNALNFHKNMHEAEIDGRVFDNMLCRIGHLRVQ